MANCNKFLLVALSIVFVVAVSAKLDNVITQWQNAAQSQVRAYGIQNQLAGRVYGLVGVAQYRALQALNLAQRIVRVKPLAAINETAVAAYAGHYVLSTLFPWSQSAIFDKLIATQLANLTASQLEVAQAIAVPVARSLMKDTVATGFQEWGRFVPSPPNGTAGKWQFTPGQTFALYPQLANAETLVADPRTLAKVAAAYLPPAVGTKAYNVDYNFTYTYGSVNSTARSAYDSGSPAFWADGANTSAIAGHWLNISYLILPENLSVIDTAQLYAKMTAAAYDASIACWKVKYTTLNWRPITAIRQGDSQHAPDPTWTPLLGTPPHPEYPSGHQCTAGAMYAVLKNYLGTDRVNFTIGSEGAPSLGNRTYTNLTTAVNEVGDSRVYGGVHFPAAGRDGTTLGEQVGNWVYKYL